MAIDTIVRDTLVEKLKQYPTILNKFKLAVDTQGITLDDIQQIIKLANSSKIKSNEAIQTSGLSNDKANQVINKTEEIETLITKINSEINRAINEEASIQKSVSQENNNRLENYNNLQNNITTEKEDRVISDNQLKELIDAKQNKLTAKGDVIINDNVIEMQGHGGNILYLHRITSSTGIFYVISTISTLYRSISAILNDVSSIISIYTLISRWIGYSIYTLAVPIEIRTEKVSRIIIYKFRNLINKSYITINYLYDTINKL